MAHADDLHRLVDALPEPARDEALVFLTGLLRRTTDAADVSLDDIAADPERRARFASAIELGWEQSERQEGRPADQVFESLRARANKR